MQDLPDRGTSPILVRHGTVRDVPKVAQLSPIPGYGQVSPASARAARRSSQLLVIIPLLCYAYFIPRGIDWNADSHLDLTRALVDHHTAVIDAYHVGLGDRSYYHGHYYTDKAPGLSLLAVPPYIVLRWLLGAPFFGSLFFVTRYLITVIVVGVPSAVAVSVLWRRLRPHVGTLWAAAGVLIWALGTLAFPYSTLFFSHQVCAVLMLAAFVMLYLPREPEHGVPDATARRLLRAGLCCGYSVACEYPTILLAFLLLAGRVLHDAVARGRSASIRVAALAGLGFLVGVAPALVYNTMIYGGLFNQGYATEAGEAQFAQGMSQGIMGVTRPSLAALWGISLSLYRGLLPLCPVLILAIPGLFIMWRTVQDTGDVILRRGMPHPLRPAALLCVAAAVTYALFNASYVFWDGGYSVGPRQFVAALPFLAVPVIFALRRRLWRYLAIPLAAFSAVTMLLSMATAPLFPPQTLRAVFADPIYGWAWPRLLNGQVDNNWGFFLGLHGMPSLVPLLVVEAILATMLVRRLRAAPGG